MSLINSVSNFRDVAIGSKMKNNILFRCAKLSTLIDEDIKKIEDLNPHSIIDFRDPKEINKAPDNLSKDLLKKYVSLPISASTLSRMVDQKNIDGDNKFTYEKVMEESYKLYINNHKHVWKEFIKILLKANNNPIIFHCSAGKDRTGIASFIIQKLCDNPMELIFENYLLSNKLLTINAATAEQTTASKKDDKLITKVMLDTLSKVKKSYLISGINEIENQFESLENYIIQELGFNNADIKDLKKLYCN
ncbi:tyrosine-protein phosphatase [Alphaproteobacteria bacterium]|nr:tyrosine-protein phosphatase [Alphaproteobacteria bacterium]MDC0110401.1 tyrosine-protein phosphatase [Alphaproteobacteria bacterium]